MFNLSGILEGAMTPMAKPLPYATPTPEQAKRFEAFLKQPITLVNIAKKEEAFDLPENLFNLTVSAPENEGDRPLATLTFDESGWDKLSYDYLQKMAASAKKDPKSVPRAMRPFAKLMARLPESPTGNTAVDNGRRVVIEKNIQAIAPGIRNVLEARLRDWRP